MLQKLTQNRVPYLLMLFLKRRLLNPDIHAGLPRMYE